MPESRKHRKAGEAIRQGDAIGQPFGEPLTPAIQPEVNRAIKSGKAKGRRPDIMIHTEEGVPVVIEFYHTHRVDKDKLDSLTQDGMAVLEWNLSNLQADPSKEEIRTLLRKMNDLPVDSHVSYLNVPTISEVVRTNKGTLDGETIKDFGKLKCMTPGCPKQVQHGRGGAFISNDLSELVRDSATEKDIVSHGLAISATLPRFSCRDHMIDATNATVPYGKEWWKHPATPNTVRKTFNRVLHDIGGMRLAASITPTLLGPQV